MVDCSGDTERVEYTIEVIYHQEICIHAHLLSMLANYIDQVDHGQWAGIYGQPVIYEYR